ncbi:hypothetical protein BpHYR1_041253 [Brachionus plicatilis]|uniref:Uncharacterized protein n=1 Tax=Brachionus plicatilis TaxID=10195 RepID=A0A3M7PZQ1_BRAPC|nr:hypothetical protein BpHYR1_041253 [Brachionus plicatilis]
MQVAPFKHCLVSQLLLSKNSYGSAGTGLVVSKNDKSSNLDERLKEMLNWYTCTGYFNLAIFIDLFLKIANMNKFICGIP